MPLLVRLYTVLYNNYYFSNTLPGAFDDEEVIHVDGEVNPVRDLETIHDELRLKDEQYCTNRLVCRPPTLYLPPPLYLPPLYLPPLYLSVCVSNSALSSSFCLSHTLLQLHGYFLESGGEVGYSW